MLLRCKKFVLVILSNYAPKGGTYSKPGSPKANALAVQRIGRWPSRSTVACELQFTYQGLRNDR